MRDELEASFNQVWQALALSAAKHPKTTMLAGLGVGFVIGWMIHGWFG